MFNSYGCGESDGGEFVPYISRPCRLDTVDQYRDLRICGRNGFDDPDQDHKIIQKIKTEIKIWNRKDR
jgi:hypothetical protein